MKALVRRTVERARRTLTAGLDARAERQLLLLGGLHAARVGALAYPPAACDPPARRLRPMEFGVFSQHGEDGIVQYLVQHVPIAHSTFVEFGVEDYRESNTRFLLMHDDWQGFVMDAAPLDHLKRDAVSWRHDLQSRTAHVTRDNIDPLLAEPGFDPDVGLLSIDIDGNDYWVWEALTAIRPRIVVCEYNPTFGLDPVAIPYDALFERHRAHGSGLYYGASVTALALLADRKGYALVGCETSGSNAFFVRRDLAVPGLGLSADQAYLDTRIRQSRDADGNLTFVRGAGRRALIRGLPVVDVSTGIILPLG